MCEKSIINDCTETVILSLTAYICIVYSVVYTWRACAFQVAHTVYPKKYAHGFCFAVLCCGYTLTDFPISIRLTSLALWQSNDCPSASKATLMNMDKYLMWIHYERLHNHNKAKHNKTACIFLGIYCKIPAGAVILTQSVCYALTARNNWFTYSRWDKMADILHLKTW